MNLIEQNFEILRQEDFTYRGIKKFIERCCKSNRSKSEITEDSYEKFIDDLVEKNDIALEFGTVHLKIEDYDSFNDFIDNLVDQGIYNSRLLKYTYHSDIETYYITTDYKYFLQLKKSSIAGALITSEDNEYYPKRYTVNFILSRSMMDEFRAYNNRLSFLDKSIFYYKEEITFIQPNWFKEERAKHTMELIDPASAIYEYSCQGAEEEYFDLIAKGLTPQQARGVLPLGIMSEFIFCGFKGAWDSFFSRINVRNTNPMIIDITNSLKKLLFDHRK